LAGCCFAGRSAACDVAGRKGAHNIWFDDEVGRSANHQKMFDVVAADQDQPAPSVNGGCVDYSESRLPSA
jgi:hypothetical protein